MKINRKSIVESIPLNDRIVDELYPVANDESFKIERDLLFKIVKYFRIEMKSNKDNFRCYIERQAYDAFLAFANDAYSRSHNEATGIIVGYYLHDEDDPSRKILVATNFIQANGPATSVTCTISYDDNIRYDNFCIAHKMNQLVWIHSHPGYGCFYSTTDSSMLASCFYANHQIGVVVDNLRNELMGFKIEEGKEKHESVFCFDLIKSTINDKLCSYPMYIKSVTAPAESKQEIDTNRKTKKKTNEFTQIGINEGDVLFSKGIELNNALLECKALLDGFIKLEHMKLFENKITNEKIKKS